MEAVAVAVPVTLPSKSKHRRPNLSGPAVRTAEGVEKQRKENEERREKVRLEKQAAAAFMAENSRKEMERKKKEEVRAKPHPAHRKIVESEEVLKAREEIRKKRRENHARMGAEKSAAKNIDVKEKPKPAVQIEEVVPPKEKEEEVVVEKEELPSGLRAALRSASKK